MNKLIWKLIEEMESIIDEGRDELSEEEVASLQEIVDALEQAHRAGPKHTPQKLDRANGKLFAYSGIADSLPGDLTDRYVNLSNAVNGIYEYNPVEETDWEEMGQEIDEIAQHLIDTGQVSIKVVESIKDLE